MKSISAMILLASSFNIYSCSTLNDSHNNVGPTPCITELGTDRTENPENLLPPHKHNE